MQEKWICARQGIADTRGEDHLMYKESVRLMLQRFLTLYESSAKFVVFDVETVGCLPGNVIVEIGAVEAGRNYVKEYRTFQKILQFRPPSWAPYQRELNIHHIPPAEIENGEARSQVLKEFLDFIAGATLVCHTNFDILSMNANLQQYEELRPALQLPVWKEYVDSCRLARKMHPGLKSASLPNLASHFAVQNPQAHRALADAITTKQVMAKLLYNYYACQKESLT
jgi:DNA polymerase III epsilon subunit-like protein